MDKTAVGVEDEEMTPSQKSLKSLANADAVVASINSALVSNSVSNSIAGVAIGSIDPGWYNSGSYTITTQQQPRCDHVMGDETELNDGSVTGFCVACGDKIYGRRMVGGLGLAKLKDAIVDALGDQEAMADLLDEIARVEQMLKVEELALKSAHEMIDMARKMVETIVLPAVEDDDDDVV